MADDVAISVGVLGPLQVSIAGTAGQIAAPKQREVLALQRQICAEAATVELSDLVDSLLAAPR